MLNEDFAFKITLKNGKFVIEKWDRKANQYRFDHSQTIKWTEHAHSYQCKPEEEFIPITQLVYVLCDEGYEVEGKKLLMEGLIAIREQEIKVEKEELASLQNSLEEFKKQAASIDETDKVEYGIRCTVEFDEAEKDWKIVENKILLESFEEGDITILEEKSLDSEAIATGNFVGFCWKKDIEECKEKILLKNYKWLLAHKRATKKEYDQKLADIGKRINMFETELAKKGK